MALQTEDVDCQPQIIIAVRLLEEETTQHEIEG